MLSVPMMRTGLRTIRKPEPRRGAGVDRPMAEQRSDRSMIEPGQWVRHPGRPEWGDGQVQSAIGSRITVNFEHQGKVLINAALVDLDILR